MQKAFSILKSQEGATIVFALMILALLTVIGIAATKTSEIELQISRNEKYHRIAFYTAESGGQVAVNWLDDQYPEISANRGLDASGGNIDFTSAKYNNSDTISLSNSTYSADVTFMGAQGNVPGYSTEFRRYTYQIDSTGTGPASARSELTVTAGKIVYVGGY